MKKKQLDMKPIYDKGQNRFKRMIKEFELYERQIVFITRYEKYLTVEVKGRRVCLWLK